MFVEGILERLYWRDYCAHGEDPNGQYGGGSTRGCSCWHGLMRRLYRLGGYEIVGQQPHEQQQQDLEEL